MYNWNISNTKRSTKGCNKRFIVVDSSNAGAVERTFIGIFIYKINRQPWQHVTIRATVVIKGRLTSWSCSPTCRYRFHGWHGSVSSERRFGSPKINTIHSASTLAARLLNASEWECRTTCYQLHAILKKERKFILNTWITFFLYKNTLYMT